MKEMNDNSFFQRFPHQESLDKKSKIHLSFFSQNLGKKSREKNEEERKKLKREKEIERRERKKRKKILFTFFRSLIACMVKNNHSLHIFEDEVWTLFPLEYLSSLSLSISHFREEKEEREETNFV